MRQLTADDLTAPEVIDTGDLIEHPRNVRRGDVPAIVESLESHGQYRPLIVQKSTMYVCAGNHTLKAIRRLAWPTAVCHVLDIDDEQALRILLADNRTADHAVYDYDQLGEVLAELADSTDGLAGTAWSSDALDDVLARLDEQAAVHVTEDPSVNTGTVDTLKEAKAKYDASTIRSFVLSFEGAQFVWMADRFRDLRDRYDLDSNATALMALFEDHFDLQAPDPDDEDPS